MPWRRHALFNVVGQMRRLWAASRSPTPNWDCVMDHTSCQLCFDTNNEVSNVYGELPTVTS